MVVKAVISRSIYSLLLDYPKFIWKLEGEDLMSEITDADKKILKALTEFTEPAGCKEIAAKAGLETRSVIGRMRKLVRLGLVSRPEKGKYIITDEGKKVARE